MTVIFTLQCDLQTKIQRNGACETEGHCAVLILFLFFVFLYTSTQSLAHIAEIVEFQDKEMGDENKSEKFECKKKVQIVLKCEEEIKSLHPEMKNSRARILFSIMIMVTDLVIS